MAKTSYISVSPGLEENFWKSLRSADRFVFSRVVKKTALLSLQRKKDVAGRSYLKICSEIWKSFSDEEKQAWKEASPYSRKHGWRTFLADQSIRIKYGIPGVATPSKFHNDWVGCLKIREPATSLKIAQYHPKTYYIKRKVPGKKGMYEPFLVVEDFSFPFKIEVNYKSNLEAVGDNAFAKFYAEIWHSYQGVDYKTPCVINLDLNTEGKGENGWVNDSASVSLFGLSSLGDFSFGSESEFLTYYLGYVLYFHLYNVRGELYFDNLKAEHSGQNWVRDPYCKKIQQAFTGVWFQIPRHWVGIDLAEGAEFFSTYLA